MGNYRLDLVTAPITEPVTITEVKGALRIDHNTDDTLIGFLITTARSNAEAYTRRAFMTQTWKMYMDSFSGYSQAYPWWSGSNGAMSSLSFDIPNNIEVPMAPLQTVTHMKTYDDSDAATTFSAASYFVGAYNGDFAQPGSITLRTSDSWPVVYRVKDGIEVQFVAGYGDSAQDVPQMIRMAIQEEAAFLYNNRGSCDGSMVSSGIAKKMLSQFRIIKL